MSLDQFINLLAVFLGGIGSIYVLKSYLEQTPETTERIAGSRMGHNLDLLDTLSAQKAEGVTGSSLIVVTLIIAIINMVFSPSEVIIHINIYLVFFLIFIISVVVYLIMELITRTIYARHLNATARVIAIRTLNRVIKDKNIPLYETKSLYLLGVRYFKMNKLAKMTSKEFLFLLAKHLNIIIPESIKIEEGNYAQLGNL